MYIQICLKIILAFVLKLFLHLHFANQCLIFVVHILSIQFFFKNKCVECGINEIWPSWPEWLTGAHFEHMLEEETFLRGQLLYVVVGRPSPAVVAFGSSWLRRRCVTSGSSCSAPLLPYYCCCLACCCCCWQSWTAINLRNSRRSLLSTPTALHHQLITNYLAASSCDEWQFIVWLYWQT